MARGKDSPGFSLRQRACGLLLPVTALPGPRGSGDLGRAAYRFVDFLASAGQRWWQMLPVGPLGPGHSPYSSPSAFAGSPLLIDLEKLVEQGLLSAADGAAPALPADRVCYGPVARFRTACLRKAFRSFQRAGGARRAAFGEFCEAEREWLADHALFCALRRAQRGRAWIDWPRELRRRRPAALGRARRELRQEIAYQQFVQFLFAQQWAALKRYAERRGVGLIGDLPMFVVHDSADVWAHQELFLLRRDGRPALVSGAPPDYFSASGQRWGHPLFRWARHRESGWGWWLARFGKLYQRFHAARIDHFLGLHRCWALPARARTARRGRWLRTPGQELLAAARQALGPLEIIAEDLGRLVPGALALRERFGLPGMRVLQFGFGPDRAARYHQPHNFPRHSVVYTGTHDNQTVVGWFRGVRRAATPRPGAGGPAERQRALRYLGSDGRQVHWDFIRLAYMSPANLALVPVQDLLGLDDRARMNTPASARGNWVWRVPPAGLDAALAGRLRELAETYERRPASRGAGRRSASAARNRRRARSPSAPGPPVAACTR